MSPGTGSGGRTGNSRAAALALWAGVLLLTWAAAQAAPQPGPRVDADLGVPIGAPLLSVSAETPPVMDGSADAIWDHAPGLVLPLHYGLHGDEPAGSIELRSVHDAQYVYFLARWPSGTPGSDPDVWRNLLTVHWRLVDPGMVSGESTGSEGLACTVGCHTVTVDGQGGLVGVRSETIPPGLDEDLPAGGGWSSGEWLVEWRRAKISPSPYDQNILDPERGYRFFVKLFLGLENHPDPTSDVHELRLRP
ncbi:MAG: hypothetical protein ACK2UC_09890 [Anaerolineae bacterium]